MDLEDVGGGGEIRVHLSTVSLYTIIDFVKIEEEIRLLEEEMFYCF